MIHRIHHVILTHYQGSIHGQIWDIPYVFTQADSWEQLTSQLQDALLTACEGEPVPPTRKDLPLPNPTSEIWKFQASYDQSPVRNVLEVTLLEKISPIS